MFKKEDFTIESPVELLEFLPILPFLVLLAPIVIGFLKLGYVMNLMGLMEEI